MNRISFFAIVMLLFGVSTIGVVAEEREVCDNYYVPTGGVYVTPKGLYVLVDDKLAQVSTLRSDEKGVYVPDYEMINLFVFCPHCRHWYDPQGDHACAGPD